MINFQNLDLGAMIEAEQCFVLYRKPLDQELYLIVDHEGGGLSSSLELQHSFVFAPFNLRGTLPILYIRGERQAVQFPLTKGDVPSSSAPIYPYVSQDYQQRFKSFHQSLLKGEFDKLVLARKKSLAYPHFKDAKQIFQRAVAAYPTAFTYILYHKDLGLWLGASPEVLLRGGGIAYETVSLAGTQPIEAGALPEEWSEKLNAEQGLVTNYLEETLSALGLRYQLQGREVISAGRLAHLKTAVRLELKEETQLIDLLQALHPTPALCGLPKEKAQQFINNTEGFDRAYYGGFLGELDLCGATNLYVNIRCLQMRSESLELYAGGGLLPSSTLEEEWLETERKLETMSSLILKKD